MIAEGTVLQKILTKKDIKAYVKSRKAHAKEVSGPLVKLEDVIQLRTPAELYEALGLIYPRSPFSLKDYSCLVMRFPAIHPDKLVAGSAEAESAIPVYQYEEPIALPLDTEIYEVTESGIELFKYEYEGNRFVPTF